jgi:hypothetical protein
LADLLSISEGNKDFRHDGVTLHWQEFVLMTDVVNTVMTLQRQEPDQEQQQQQQQQPQQNYNSAYKRIQPDPPILRLVTDLKVLDDEERYLKSTTIEPSNNKLSHSRSLSKLFQSL